MRTRFPSAALAVILLSCLSCEAHVPHLETLEWVRRGRVYVHAGAGATLTIGIEPTHGPDEYAYLIGPDGRTLERRLLARGARMTLERELVEGPGVYTLVPSPSHRMRVTAADARLTFEPETSFPSLHLLGERTYFFHVPEGTAEFTIAVTNQSDWEGAGVRVGLLGPDGEQAHRFELEPFDRSGLLRRLGISEEMQARYEAQGDTAVVPEFRLLVERHTIESPAPGQWRVVAEVRGHRSDDIGFWLEGIPNRFSATGGVPLPPDTSAVSVSTIVNADRVLGPTGDVGAVWGWTAFEDEALDAYRKMGLSGAKNFYPQVDMEGRVEDGVFVGGNDDDDPGHIDWDGFLFRRFRYRMDVYDTQVTPLTMLAVISRVAPWAAAHPAEIAEFAEAAVRFHQLEAPVDASRLYWQFLNEPNHEVTLGAYVTAFEAVGARLRARLENEGVGVRLGGPATGNAWSEPTALPWEWIEALLTRADDVLDFVVWNQYRLGRIEDAWRYAAHVAHADSLIRVLDSDGQVEEILIGATNLRGGIVLQNERQDGPYSAIWWPAVICHALGTGRCRLLNYFWLIDQGSRRKGLLNGDWSMKPVGHANAFASRYRGREVVEARSDHDGVSVLATRGSSGALFLLAVNTLRRPVALELTCENAPGDLADVETFDAETLRTDLVRAAAPVGDPLAIALGPWSLAGVRIDALEHTR